jgi:hypothetical protein
MKRTFSACRDDDEDNDGDGEASVAASCRRFDAPAPPRCSGATEV